LPSIYAPGNVRGITAPITAAGSLALGNAGQLAGMVLSQIKRAGSPFLRSNPGGTSSDLRSMVSLYCAPDSGSYGWDLIHHYGVPSFGTAGASDAKTFDAQAAGETALMLFENWLNGANLIHDVGYLDCAMTGSLELVAYCAEVIGWIRHYMRDLDINEETLALDLIDELGPDGYFIDSDHTYEYLESCWVPTLWDRLDFPRWEERGSTNLQQRANITVKEIIAEHRAERLPPDVVAKLDEITWRE
jgi:trimethylamine--corrinoid protein Co-methyltransferase